MTWSKNRRIVSEGFRDLEYLPPGKTSWNFTLCPLAWDSRRHFDKPRADFAIWAEHNRLAPSHRYQQLGEYALLLWHGTSLERAEKIAQYGLFHKGGVWTTLRPSIAHSYCRSRSRRFDVDGAMVGLVFDSREIREGVDYSLEAVDSIYRFHHGITPQAVEYVFTHDHVIYTGEKQGKHLRYLPRCKFKSTGNSWMPVRKQPSNPLGLGEYRDLEEFCRLNLEKYYEDYDAASAIELFSLLYASVVPVDALRHSDVLDLIDRVCEAKRSPGKKTVLTRKEVPS